MFNGSIVALATPFTERDEIDFVAFDRLVDFHLENGSDGLVLAGTTGESAVLSGAEFTGLLEHAINRVDGRLKILAGTGSASTARAIEQTGIAAELGADGALIVTPYYNRPTQRGLAAHFSAIADAVNIPVVLYNVPSRTAVDLLPATVETLSSHDRIVGIKEAVAQSSRIEELCARCGPDFIVLSGDDHSCLEAMKKGAQGVISVAANVVPKAMHDLCLAASLHDWSLASEIDSGLRQLFEVLMIETNPIPVKWALFAMNLVEPGLRLPLTRLDRIFQDDVKQCLIDLGLIPS